MGLKKIVPDSRADKALAIWLFAVAGLVFVMVIVGGATRLTESGLSITEWRPITGVLPPLSQAGWEAELEKYRQIPEYQLINRGMSLEDFKTIYYWEWGHRLLGRLIGVAYFIPFVAFLALGWVQRNRMGRLTALLLLGGAQGGLGWYMVMSGLADRVDVSQYRLAAHLGLAFLIYGALIWTALDYVKGTWGIGQWTKDQAVPVWIGASLALLIFIQIILGALVAGLNAGFIYNTWPLMDGALIPPGLLPEGGFGHVFESHLTTQFVHRAGGYAVLLAGFTAFAWATFTRRRRDARLFGIVLGLILLQILVGIWTLVAVVPLSLGLLHQALALVVWTAAIATLHSQAARPVAG